MLRTFAVALLFATVLVDAKKDKKDKKNKNEIATDRGDDAEFLDWAAKNNKNYKDSESIKVHKQKFKEAKMEVERLNTKVKGKKNKAKFELNWLADLTDEEKQNLLGAFEDIGEGEGRRLADEWEPAQGRHLQEAAGPINWADEGNLTPVKNQGGCGSCVAFATTTAVEGLVSIRDGTEPVRLSEQHMVDCAARGAENVSTDYGNYGCGGGWIYKYFNFVIGEGAVEYDDYRAYSATDGTCEHDPADVAVQGSQRGYVSGTVQDIID